MAFNQRNEWGGQQYFGQSSFNEGGGFGNTLFPSGGAGFRGGAPGGQGAERQPVAPLERGGSFGSELTAFVEQHQTNGGAYPSNGGGFGAQGQPDWDHYADAIDLELFDGMGAGVGGIANMPSTYGQGSDPFPVFHPQQQQQQQMGSLSPVPPVRGMGGESSRTSPTGRHLSPRSPRRISPRSPRRISPRLSPSNSSESLLTMPGHSPRHSELYSQYERAAALVDELSQLGYDEQSNLDKIRQVQRQVIANPTKEGYDMLYQQHVQVKERVDSELRALSELRTQLILPPACIPRVDSLHHLISMQLMEIELLHQELLSLAAGNPSQCFAVLAFQTEPFPMVVSKGKRMEDEVVVKVITGAGLSIDSLSEMKASAVWEAHTSKSSSASTIPPQTLACDAERAARWHLKFTNGTRKQPITLRFSIQIEARDVNGRRLSSTLESRTSSPLIVITNECQWEEGEGTLLRSACFHDDMEPIPWCLFANTLQKHIIRGTRQDPLRPTRCLTFAELEYMHAKFFGSSETVSPNMFDAFWNWFGKTFQKLRYQRHVLPLWIDGYIHSFLSREAVNDMLLQQEPGTFLVRFSEHNPGLFALVYRTDEHEHAVRHYLIRPQDTNAAKRTLPDFLGEHPTLHKAMRVQQERGGPGGLHMLANVRYRRVPKNDAFERFYSKKDDPHHINGYDDSVCPAVTSQGLSAHSPGIHSPGMHSPGMHSPGMYSSSSQSYSPLDDFMNAE